MDEFRAELHRHRDAGKAACMTAPANPVSCFDQQNRTPGARELRGRGESGGTGADYEDVDLNRRTSQGTMMSSAVSARKEAEIG